MIELVPRTDILDIRWRVLRPRLPRESAEYPQDANPEIFHLGARDRDGQLVACVTFFPEPVNPGQPDDPLPAWRFRGMATLDTHRGQGIGGRLLERGVAEATARGAAVIWCQGRVAAADFYRRHGFVSRGEQFEVAPIGAHYLFTRPVSTAPV